MKKKMFIFLNLIKTKTTTFNANGMIKEEFKPKYAEKVIDRTNRQALVFTIMV